MDPNPKRKNENPNKNKNVFRYFGNNTTKMQEATTTPKKTAI